ncbi:MAG: hypothetical protein JWM57_3545 [Phycisphaerales bacterium]|nr:hypothetical protein [Phycisphaerales bacterium]
MRADNGSVIALKAPPLTSEPVGRSVWIAGLSVALLALAMRCCFVVEQYDGDMELFVYMGKLFGQGGRIGIELIDNKLPLVGPLMWPAYLLVGGWWAGYALLSIVMSVLATIAIVRTVAIVRPSSTWPTAAMASVWIGFPLAVSAAFKLEHVQILTGSIAALAIMRCWKTQTAWNAFAAGLCAGIGALAKPTALSVLVGGAAALLVWNSVDFKTRLRLALYAAAGVATAGAVALGYLIESGAIRAVPALVEQIRLYNSNSVWVGSTILVKFLSTTLILGGPLMIRGVAERKRAEPRNAGEGVPIVFALVWFAVELTGIVMQGRLYTYHFLPLMAPASLLFGLIARKPSAMTTLIAPVPVLFASVVWTYTIVLHTPVPTDRLAANDYVKSHAAKGDAVWMDEEARILVESDLKAGSRIPLTFIFSNHDDAPQQFLSVLLSDFESRKPRWIVFASDWPEREDFHRRCQAEYAFRPRRGENLIRAWTELAGYVDSRYQRRARFGALDVYELKPAVVTADVR